MTTLERSSSTAERPLDEPVMTFDLGAILADLKREPTWQKSGRNSVTLLKQEGLRVVLVALGNGAELAPHDTDSPVSLQGLEGQVAVRIGNDERILGAGQLLSLQPGLTHAVRAQNEAAFLLTLASECVHPAEIH
jgi:quercetin dioxygenase-like cupin family protein